MLDLAQKAIGRLQLCASLFRHQARLLQGGQGLQGGAHAQLGKLAAAHHLQQLADEFNFADAACAQLDITLLRAFARCAQRRLAADLCVQLAQGFKYAVIKVFAKHERNYHIGQRLGAGFVAYRPAGGGAAFEPGQALPFAPLQQKVFFQRRQRDSRRPRIAIGAQRQIDTKDLAVLGVLGNMGADQAHQFIEILLVADLPTAIGAACGLAFAFIDKNDVDIAGGIEFARAQFTHAHDPQHAVLPQQVLRPAMQFGQLGAAVGASVF